jgi:hypothetical protein
MSAFKQKHLDTVRLLEKMQKQNSNDLLSMMKAAKNVFRDNAIGRLKMIAALHDFDNIHLRISQLEDSII